MTFHDQLHPMRGPGRTLSAVCLLLWLVLVTLWLTWAPYEPLSPDSPARELAGSYNPVRLAPRLTLTDVLGNLLLLAPVGVVVALARSRRPVLGALVVGALVSIGIEAGQILLPGRVVSVADVLLNSAGAAGGGWLAVRLVQRYRAERVARTLAAGVYACFAASLIHGGYALGRGFRLADWDPTFEIASGDEVDADRRYVGRVEDAWICAGADSEPVCAAPGAGLEERTRLVRAAEASQTVELRARVLSASDSQSGPTRIVTFSRGGLARNVTLGQEGTALVLRIRTPLTGPNGRSLEIWIPDAIRAAVPAEVRTRFAGGPMRTIVRTVVRTESAAAGETRVETQSFDALSHGILLGSTRAVTPRRVAAAHGLAVLILALPLLFGAAAYAWGRGRPA